MCMHCPFPTRLSTTTVSSVSASANDRGIRADNEHMACSDHFTTAWWEMLTWPSRPEKSIGD